MCIYQGDSHGWIVFKFHIWQSLKFVEMLSFWLKLDKHSTRFMFTPTYIYDLLLWLIFIIKTKSVLYEVHAEAQATDEQWTWTVNIKC